MTGTASPTLPLPLVCQGKVREVYQVDEQHLLLVASDRVSAFDVVMNETVPSKGAVLTQLSAYWFKSLAPIVPSHFVTADTSEIIGLHAALRPHRRALAGRAMLVRRTDPIRFECVVRGYLAGSAWAEYQAKGTLAGEPLPQGLVESSRLDPPLFSPATKADSGHDENVTQEVVAQALGSEMLERLRDASLKIYRAGAEMAAKVGIILADTKFEFGTTTLGELLLIDEVLTPDSSRFWPADQYQPGEAPPSFDKQPLRDYLAVLKREGMWDGQAPPPRLPPEVIEAMSRRYREIYQRLTGTPLEVETW